MGWNTGAIVSDAEQVKYITLPAAADEFVGREQETRAQLDAAKSAAQLLLRTGVVGTDKKFAVELSGHASPGHRGEEDHGLDLISVVITQQR